MAIFKRDKFRRKEETKEFFSVLVGLYKGLAYISKQTSVRQVLILHVAVTAII